MTSQKVSQTINTLKPGKYSLTAVMRTNELEHLTTQHIYVTVGDETKEAFMSEAGIGTNMDAWETLIVPFEVSFENQPVEIGVASSGNGTQSGWFKADDFRFRYHGTSSTTNSIQNNIIESVYVKGGKGCVEIISDINNNISIYNIDATLAYKGEINKGTNTIILEKGIYIILGKLITIY